MRIKKRIPGIFLSAFIFVTSNALAQEEATILVIPNLDAKIIVDGIDKGQTKAGSALRVTTVSGEHYVEAQSVNGLTKGEIVQLEAGKQKILKIEFEISPQITLQEIIPVADINFEIPGFIDAISDEPEKSYPYPIFYYAFEKGDEITLNISMSNKKGTNLIEMSTYPDGVVRYTNNSFIELKDMKVKVPERAIYKFKFATNHIFPRNCFLKVSRTPASAEAINFNTKVTLKRILTPVSIHEPEDLYVNSATNLSGKTRILIPVKLPPNTIEWFYRFSASRSKEDIANVKKNFGLLGELTTLVFNLTGVGAAVTSIAVEKLSQPPGANYCDVFFIEHKYIGVFEAKQDDQWKYITEGSRMNLSAGNVKITCCNEGQYYLGIRNPDISIGVNVSIEVVAITAKDEYSMDN
jgi:hypothetical protein